MPGPRTGARSGTRGGDLLSTHTARIVEDIGKIAAADWNACAAPSGTPHNPFLRHEFLHALETSRSAIAKTGWRPCHVVLEDAGSCIGVVPMYLKAHSQGEYVFDHSW